MLSWVFTSFYDVPMHMKLKINKFICLVSVYSMCLSVLNLRGQSKIFIPLQKQHVC